MIQSLNDPIQAASAGRRPHMSNRSRLLFMLTAWAIVLMPFLFWRATWFGRALSDAQIENYLHNESKPRHIQHALIQIGDRMQAKEAKPERWYPDLVRLAGNRVEEIRNTDAWVMGQDTSRPEFHEALLKMLRDVSLTVRGNAALSLVRFGDASGRPQIVAMLQPATVTTSAAGRVADSAKAGDAVRGGALLAKVQRETGGTLEVRSPITGRVRSMQVSVGRQVAQGAELATVDPDSNQVWEALRALYLVGQAEDLPAVTPYARGLADMPVRVRQQAVLTEEAIRQRSGS